MDSDKISIILPVFNKSKYVANILSDIKEQSYNNYECIVVNDGSTDESGIICQEYAQKDSRFVIVDTKNMGVSHARNIGLKMATGKFITFVDADDRVGPDYLKFMHVDAKKSNADIVIACYEKWWETNNRRLRVELPYSGLQKMGSLLTDFACVQKKTGIYGFCCGKLIKAGLLKGIWFDEEYTLAEDFEYYLRLYPSINTVYFDNQCCYYYLQQAEYSSMIIEDNKIDYLSQLFLNLKYREFLCKTNVYENENKKIVNQLLSDYAFFTVFHSNRSKIQENVNKIHCIINEKRIKLDGRNVMQKVISIFISYNNWIMIKCILLIYDFLRKLKKTVKG